MSFAAVTPADRQRAFEQAMPARATGSKWRSGYGVDIVAVEVRHEFFEIFDEIDARLAKISSRLSIVRCEAIRATLFVMLLVSTQS